MQPRAWVYILASRRNGTLYVGSTTDLSRRVWEHKMKLTLGFTSDYGVTMLVWYEGYDRIMERATGSTRSRSGAGRGSSN
jgi:putative endonuclease